MACSEKNEAFCVTFGKNFKISIFQKEIYILKQNNLKFGNL